MAFELKKICEEINNVDDPVNEKTLNRICQLIINSNHIYFSGSGRSGLMIKSFANRLLQLGLEVSVVGEISSPHTHSNDLLIFNSASGKSEKLIAQAKIAKNNGLKEILFTVDNNSPLAQFCEIVVQINAQSKFEHNKSIQPMGALFEQFSLLLFDSIILRLMKELNITEEQMIQNHADIE